MDKTIRDDSALIELIAQAQTDAIEELYDRYNRLIYRVAFAIVGDRAAAEEILLDVYIQVWRRAGTYRADQAKVSTWLIAIARHRAIDVLRRQKFRSDADWLNLEHMPLPDGLVAGNPEEHTELTLQQERVRKAVSQLPVDQQQALALAYFGSYTQTQVAEALQQPLGTIKTRIRTAMQNLRKMLEEE